MIENKDTIENNIASSRPKIAVIGTGAAGLGVLTALLEKKNNFEIVVYDIGKNLFKPTAPSEANDEWVSSFYNNIYKEIRSSQSFKFPPPKTHFAKGIPRLAMKNSRLNVFKSEAFGGLTNYWGATMLPFTDREMKGWPIKKEALYPYYQKIADLVGLAGAPDALNDYFIRDFSTRPAINILGELNKLNQTINHYSLAGSKFKIISGLNRCGLETREDKSNHCVCCGECLAGCFRDSIYSSRMAIKRYYEDSRLRRVEGKVSRINQKNRSLEIETENGLKESGFSKIFVGAGCVGSTEIAARSLGLKNELIMADNAVYVFPIFYSGRKIPSNDSYLSLCNLIVGCVPNNKNEHFSQAQIYPNFDYLWRYNIPPKIWPIIKTFASFGRRHLFWGRLYFHSDYSQSYSLKMENNELVINLAKQADASSCLKSIMDSMRQAVNHKGFYIPPIPPIRQRVNSHYAATLGYNNNLVKVSPNSEIMPNVYLCDSSVFPNSPAVNPAFTIMANAYRIADEAII